MQGSEDEVECVESFAEVSKNEENAAAKETPTWPRLGFGDLHEEQDEHRDLYEELRARDASRPSRRLGVVQAGDLRSNTMTEECEFIDFAQSEHETSIGIRLHCI